VRRRVLGPEIEGEIAQSRLGHGGLASAAGSTPTADTGSNLIRFQPQARWQRCRELAHLGFGRVLPVPILGGLHHRYIRA
jgi:hypothetical protein